MIDAEISFRPYTPDDINFILNSWGSSYYKDSPDRGDISPHSFHKHHRPIRDQFFTKPNAAVIVACDPDDPWTIAGWVAVEQGDPSFILHYLYVKTLFRKRGIATRLLELALPRRPVRYSHETRAGIQLMRRHADHFKQFEYGPHLI